MESKWSEAETAFLKKCLDRRWTAKHIGQHFPHRSRQSIKGKIEWERRARRFELNRGGIPANVIADRDRRAAEYRSPAQILMGEPPPSQSALAKRQPGNSAD